MISNEFESSVNQLMESISKLRTYLPKGESRSSALLRRMHQDRFMKDLTCAIEQSSVENMENAWSHLVKAAEAVGFLHGINDAEWRNGSEQQVIELLRKNGGLGGTIKGQNAEGKRGEAAKALIEAAPNGKWPSKAAFDLGYHSIVKKVPGFKDTDYQRRKIISRPDVRATLPLDSKRRR